MAQICGVNDEDMQLVSWTELVVGLLIVAVGWYAYVVLR
jgi:hypothetical protein